MDNASWHTSGFTRKYFSDRNVKLLFNIPHEPELNCIEKYFSVVKNYFKRIKMQRIVLKKSMNVDLMIR
jgi:transposase